MTTTATGFLRHPLVVASLAELLIIAPLLIGLSSGPSWQTRPLLLGTPGEYLQPNGWSPDGTRFTVQRTDQFLIVRARDGSVLRTVFGRWPVWLTDDTIYALRDVGGSRTQLVRGDARSGMLETPTIIPGIARLVGGASDLAATNLIGSIETVILDPIDGSVDAVLPGLRAIAWSRPGTLILKKSDPDLQAFGVRPGSLFAWTTIEGVRPIGERLIEVQDTIVPSPSGDAIACACAIEEAGSLFDQSINVIPVDGTAPTRLSSWKPGGQAHPFIAWFDERALVFLDGAGMHRVEIGAGTTAMPRLDPGQLFDPENTGRVYRMGDSLAIAAQEGGGSTGKGSLTVVGPSGEAAFRGTYPSWNPLYMIVDPRRSQAVVVSDPQLPEGRPDRIAVLAYD